MIELFTFTTPWDLFLSKNKRYVGKHSKRIRPEHVTARQTVAVMCKLAMRKAGYLKLWKTKVYVDLFVAMPNYRSDPHNMLDDAVDAMEPILGVNDAYYIAGVRDAWIDKKNPQIRYTVSVETTDPMKTCKCGNLRGAECCYCGAGYKSTTQKKVLGRFVDVLSKKEMLIKYPSTKTKKRRVYGTDYYVEVV